MAMKPIPTKLPDNVIEKISKLIGKKKFPNRNNAIVSLLKKQLKLK